jgi:5-methylcytosine-specific restriction enzyme subunit McrC
MMPIVLWERDRKREFRLPDDAVAHLQTLSRYVVLEERRNGMVALGANQYVGAFRTGRTEVWIHPKVPVRRLLYLLGFSDQDRWWDDNITLNEASGLVPAMAMLFAKQADRALDHGTPPRYRQVTTTAPTLRGRLLETSQMRRRSGLALPVEVRYDRLTVDVPENQLLLTAAHRLLPFTMTIPRAHAGLQRCIARLAGVTKLAPGRPLPLTPMTRLNAHYQSALRLARMILADRSVELSDPRVADVPVTGFLLNMEIVFQDYLAGALRRQLAGRGQIKSQDCYALDVDGRLTRKPDVTFWRDGTCVAIADAKYRRREQTNFSADINRLFVMKRGGAYSRP